MAQIGNDLYESLARNFHNTRRVIVSADAYIDAAVQDVVNVTTTNYPAEDGAVMADISAAIAVEVALLSPVNGASVQTKNITASSATLTPAVGDINSYVIRNFDGDTIIYNTDKLKLDNYVANIDWRIEVVVVSPSIPADPSALVARVPYYWGVLSSSAGFDVSDWDINVNPITGNFDIGINTN